MKVIKKDNKRIAIIDHENRNIILNVLYYKRHLKTLTRIIKDLMLYHYNLLFLYEFDINSITTNHHLKIYDKESQKVYYVLDEIKNAPYSFHWLRSEYNFRFESVFKDHDIIFKDFLISWNSKDKAFKIESPNGLTFDKSLNIYNLEDKIYYTGSDLIHYEKRNYIKAWRQLVQNKKAKYWSYSRSLYNKDIITLSFSNGENRHISDMRITPKDLEFLLTYYNIEETWSSHHELNLIDKSQEVHA